MTQAEMKKKLFSLLIPDEDYNENNMHFTEVLYMIEHSEAPLNFMGKKLQPEPRDFDAFERLKEIQLDIKDYVQSGNNLYLHSANCGNGKTTWSVKLMFEYFDNVWYANCYEPRGLFISVPLFLQNLKRIFITKNAEFDNLLKLITKVDIVVWDDIAATKLSEYDFNNILAYVDRRLLEEKCNIYTGNLAPDELLDALGPRLTSRILGSEQIELKGQDKR